MIGKEKIDEIVKKIADNIKPEKIVLFGSYAYGNPAKHSDLDLCVVLNEDIKNPDIGWEIRKLFWGWFIPMDIVVYTQKDIMPIELAPNRVCFHNLYMLRVSDQKVDIPKNVD